jgi:FSR family fosmidomycin resistance protein-like MFS transporter
MTATTANGLSNDIKVISLVSVAHGCSHFFQLVLPPLFPMLVASNFAPGYTELGVMMTVFFVASGFSQVAAGFLVDRFGALRVLILGLSIYCLVILGFAVAPAFWMYYPLAALMGLGNCVFHPADFTIMNASLDPKRLGRAFGFHTLGGNMGWALAPGFMLGLAYLIGWRGALIAAASIGIVIVLTLIWQRDAFRPQQTEAGPGKGAAMPTTSISAMLSLPVFYCFLYFCLLAMALIAVQNFLPPTLLAVHGTPLDIGNTALTGFLLGASAGVMAGGILADRSQRYGLTIGIGLVGAAVLFAAVGTFALPVAVMIAGISMAGFLTGMTTPSRDLLVRSATPPGATGRVFGFVYSGLDVGSAFAPVTIGILLDAGQAHWVFWVLSAILLLAIGTAVAVRPAPAH